MENKMNAKEVLSQFPPTDPTGFHCPVMVYIFPNHLVHHIFTNLDVRLVITQALVEKLFDFGKLSSGEVAFYYPETFMPPRFHKEFMEKLSSCWTEDTKSIQIITASPTLVHGLNRSQILICE